MHLARKTGNQSRNHGNYPEQDLLTLIGYFSRKFFFNYENIQACGAFHDGASCNIQIPTAVRARAFPIPFGNIKNHAG